MMYHRHALIVDDSKTAQFRLKRMLEIYELEVDVASSAEEALAYLSYRAPTVIFLDQSMEGMNGIEALRTIKSNPTTATIPVIMYTSEKGEMFTSQARALGALDILNKSAMAPSNLDKMLQTLKIPHRKKGKTEAATKAPAEKTPSTASKQKPIERQELEELQRQIARLFEIHIADVGRQISKSTQFLSKRLHVQAENAAKAQTEVVVGDVPLNVLNKEVTAERRRMALVSNSLLVLVFFAVIIVGGIALNMVSRLSALSDNYDTAMQLSETNTKIIGRLANDLKFLHKTTPSTQLNPKMLDTLTWIANADFSFGLEQQPLGEEMIQRIQQLTYQLADIGYEGLVEINIHIGNSCLARGRGGQLAIAPDNLSAFECILRASVEEDLTVDDYLTLPYLNFEQSSPILRNQLIALAVNTVSFDNPRVTYPYITDTTTAAEWNRTAAQNSYLSFTFHPAQ